MIYILCILVARGSELLTSPPGPLSYGYFCFQRLLLIFPDFTLLSDSEPHIELCRYTKLRFGGRIVRRFIVVTQIRKSF